MSTAPLPVDLTRDALIRFGCSRVYRAAYVGRPLRYENYRLVTFIKKFNLPLYTVTDIIVSFNMTISLYLFTDDSFSKCIYNRRYDYYNASYYNVLSNYSFEYS